MLTSKGERITADSDEAAPSFRVIAPPDCGMTSPLGMGSAGSDCCQFIRMVSEDSDVDFGGGSRRSDRWALWTKRSRIASA